MNNIASVILSFYLFMFQQLGKASSRLCRFIFSFPTSMPLFFNYCPPQGKKEGGETRVEFVRGHEQVIGTSWNEICWKRDHRLSPLFSPIHRGFSLKRRDVCEIKRIRNSKVKLTSEKFSSRKENSLHLFEFDRKDSFFFLRHERDCYSTFSSARGKF